MFKKFGILVRLIVSQIP